MSLSHKAFFLQDRAIYEQAELPRDPQALESQAVLVVVTVLDTQPFEHLQIPSTFCCKWLGIMCKLETLRNTTCVLGRLMPLSSVEHPIEGSNLLQPGGKSFCWGHSSWYHGKPFSWGNPLPTMGTCNFQCLGTMGIYEAFHGPCLQPWVSPFRCTLAHTWTFVNQHKAENKVGRHLNLCGSQGQGSQNAL